MERFMIYNNREIVETFGTTKAGNILVEDSDGNQLIAETDELNTLDTFRDKVARTTIKVVGAMR